ncbi:Ribosomal protein S18 acetylase RimI [Amycolatopsis marina]|uniref:Ribosomal protein S18 acetylase RimI n=1 Tax=Amycolatopsis marina TaxID=490629 RepID=A0A1I1CAQ0_9PSEU|nr:GNAT family N-acetyltransferase [Amycolatopsis marina]SFB59731.1 Ribosomal protein S18 acetylase RimI [Amycolatopsis marina]
MAPIIRDARTEDWPRIWPFWHWIAAAGETIAWDPDTESEQAERIWMAQPPVRVFVAEEGGRIVGSAQLRPNYGPISRVANATFLVDPECGGRGLGRRLAQHVLDAARGHGYRAMVFNAVVETNVGAVHLYHSMGFRTLATVPRAFDHPRLGPVGMHVMHLEL